MTSETMEPKEPRAWTYAHAEFARLYAPAEKTAPGLKLRALLRSRFLLRRSDPERAYVATAGAHDAMTASLMTDLGFEAIHAGAWQLSVARGMCPDLGLQPSHAMVELTRELVRGVEAARDKRFFETGGELLAAPPIFADMQSGFGGPLQAFALARELFRAGAAGAHVDDQDPAERSGGLQGRGTRRPKTLVRLRCWMEKLIAVKAAAQAAGGEPVIIARTDAVEGDAPGERGGGLERAIERGLAAASLGVDLLWPEFASTDPETPLRFAEAIHKSHPEQMLAFNLSPALRWGQAKQEGRILTNRQLGQMGYALQFSTLLAFRTAGMALETWLRGFRQRGLDALADLQLVETASLDGEPRSRMHERFAGTHRWQALEQAIKGAK